MAIAKLFCIFLYLVLITLPLSSPLPNFLFIITDDQDDIDSYTVMPSIRNDIVGKGAKLSNSFVTSPICCPSRTSLFSGRFPHNLDDDIDGWCGNYYCNGRYMVTFSQIISNKTLHNWSIWQILEWR
jgi:N-acetylglucosamine-6-sulfatase